MCDQLLPGVTNCDQMWPNVTVVTRWDLVWLIWPVVVRSDQGWPDLFSFEQMRQVWSDVTSWCQFWVNVHIGVSNIIHFWPCFWPLKHSWACKSSGSLAHYPLVIQKLGRKYPLLSCRPCLDETAVSKPWSKQPARTNLLGFQLYGVNYPSPHLKRALLI